MEAKKRSSIKGQMFKIILWGIFIPLIILIVISAIKFNSFAEKIAKEEALAFANDYGDNIYRQFYKAFAAVDYYAEIQSALFNEEGISRFTFDELQKIDHAILKNNKYILDVYTILDPNRIIVDKETKKLNENMILYGSLIQNNNFSELIYNDYHYKSNIKDSLKNGNGYLFLPPYYDIINGDSILMVSYTHQITYNRNIVGNVGIDITINWIQDYIKTKSLFGNITDISIITGNGIIIANNKNSSLIGKNIHQVYTEKADKKFLNIKQEKVILENGNYKFYVPIIFKTLKNPLFIRISVPQKYLLKDSLKELLKRVSSALIILLSALFITYYYSKNIIKRISRLANLTKKISKGHLNISFDDSGNDEIKELNDTLKNMIERFSEIMGSIKNTTEKLYNSSTDLSNVAIKLSEGAAEQASSTEEVSASMEQMTAIIEQNAENAKIADTIARKSANGIADSSKNVEQTTKSMGEIANKTSIIGDIAFQTNILALNAAVEAARAGVHGKGFGVVAAEVGKLAENSKKAANEIDELTNKSFIIAKRSGELLQNIEPDIKKTALLVQEIANASIEQKAGTEQINNAIQQLNNVTQENAGSAELLATNVEVLNALADKLGKLTGFFKLEK